MKQSSFGEPDYAFGQTMLTLRTSIGLTQAGLAKPLEVSRRAVGEWEAGSSYPKVEHLKALIALGIQHRAFPVGREEEEIRALWQATHQKMLLDEPWLSSLLQQDCPLSPPTPPLSREEVPTSEVVKTQPAASGLLIDWGQTLAVPNFYGREQEMDQLSEWILQERCRVVSLLGMGGIGKSALAVKVMHRVAEHFDVVIFRSLRDSPSCEELLDDCLQVLAPQPLGIVPTSLEERLNLLLEQLRTSHTLLVLDNLESLLQEGNIRGHLRPGYAGYERLLRLVAETPHQSCLLLTSREKPAMLRSLEGRRSPVRSLRLAGLDHSACERLFAENEVEGTPQEQLRLVEAYAGNPLALKIVTEAISDLFGGQIGQFLAEEVVIFGNITDLLKEQIARLSSLEQTVLYWLAIVREPLTLNELLTFLVTSPPQVQIFESIDGLRRRSLVERGQCPGSLTLQSVVQEYVTTMLIEEATREIQQGHLDRLIQYSLEQVSAREYVRQTQVRLLLTPIIASLQNAYRGKNEVEELLLSQFDQLREWADYAQGYGPANLIALLWLHRGHLRGIDLSHLVIRGAYLQGIEMQDASLAGALICDTVFTETFDAIWSIAVSSTGKFWAVGSRRGEVRVWKEQGRSLHLAWQAHANVVSALAFSPDGSTLASGSWDGTIKLWDLENGVLLWTGRDAPTASLVFSPDSSMLASGEADATVKFWDARSGTNLQILPHPGSVCTVTWSPDGGMLASGDVKGCIRLWQIQKTAPATCVQIIEGHSDWVHGLAFASNGSILASGSWDRTVKLWEVTNGRLLHTLSAHTDKVHGLAWSPEGCTIASCSLDKTIWLWDAAQGHCRMALRGHTAAVYSLAFTPDGGSLLSGGEDGTLRVWDVVSGQCIRILQGYATYFYDIDWSPDGIHLVSGGTDTQVTLWDVTSETQPTGLHGHTWIVYGVAWSPDGRWLASSELITAIRIWDATSGACVQLLEDPEALPFGVAWSPDGQWLAIGTDKYGIQVWERTKQCLICSKQALSTMIRHIAWSPDGTRVVGGGDDGSVYLWEAANGTRRQQQPGHHGAIKSVAFSPEGSLLASAGGSELLVWEVQSGACVRALAEHSGSAYAVVWGPTEDQLISGDSDGILRWWEVHSGQCIRQQEAHRGTIQSLKISPDSRRLASCGDDGTIQIWDVESGEHLCTLRRDRPYEHLNITGIRGLTQAAIATLRALGAVEDETSI